MLTATEAAALLSISKRTKSIAKRI